MKSCVSIWPNARKWALMASLPVAEGKPETKMAVGGAGGGGPSELRSHCEARRRKGGVSWFLPGRREDKGRRGRTL